MTDQLCAICAAPFVKASSLATSTGYRVYQCARCRGESVSPLPRSEELLASYQSFVASRLAMQDFDQYVHLASVGLKREVTELFSGRDEILAKGGSFLDYGCGAGHYVAAARSLGFRAVGLEVDRASVGFGRLRGLDLRHGQLPQDMSLFGKEGFDYIRTMHVLEHLADPMNVLRALIRLLNRNGALVIGVPDQSSFPAVTKKLLRAVGVRRDAWGFVQPPIHLHGFTPFTLKTIGQDLNLTTIYVRPSSPLDAEEFPSTENYWRGLRIHRLVYWLGKRLGSPGFLLAAFRQS